MATWRPGPADIQRVFDEQNPWHRTGVVPPSLAQDVERPLGGALWHQLVAPDLRRFQVVLGPRQVGKTTALYQTVRHLLNTGVAPNRIWWMRLDHPLLMERPLDELVLAAASNARATDEEPVFLMLDELVYTPRWDSWLKTFYDDAWPVRIAATSSATAALRERRRESGVGRWSEQYLAPHSFWEFLDLVGQRPGVEVGATLADSVHLLRTGLQADHSLAGWRQGFLLVGGFPELLLRSWGDSDQGDRLLTSQQVLRADAVERAVYKDIPQSFGVDNPMALERLLYVLAAQVTGIFSAANVSRELGMSQPTIDRYLGFLEQAFLVFALPNYAGNEATVQRRGRKLYFVDGAVRNAALQRGLAPLDDPSELGALLENLVAASLHALAVQSGVRLHHWRDRGHEVDLVWAHPTAPLAFEIASSTRHATTGLRTFMDRFPSFRGRCYLVTPQAAVLHPAPGSTEIGTMPLDHLLLVIGAQGEQVLAEALGPRPSGVGAASTGDRRP